MAAKKSGAQALKKTKKVEPKYYTALVDMFKDKAKGKLPRGAHLKIDTDAIVTLIGSQGANLSNDFATTDVAAVALRKLGFKVENKND